MTDRDETYDKVVHLIAPFNKKGADLSEATTFAGDDFPGVLRTHGVALAR